MNREIPERLGAAALAAEALRLFTTLYGRHQSDLNAGQVRELWLATLQRHPAAALNLLLGQLAAREVVADPDLVIQANVLCDRWAAAAGAGRKAA